MSERPQSWEWERSTREVRAGSSCSSSALGEVLEEEEEEDLMVEMLVWKRVASSGS